jgi:hypothetical protein
MELLRKLRTPRPTGAPTWIPELPATPIERTDVLERSALVWRNPATGSWLEFFHEYIVKAAKLDVKLKEPGPKLVVWLGGCV